MQVTDLQFLGAAGLGTVYGLSTVQGKAILLSGDELEFKPQRH